MVADGTLPFDRGNIRVGHEVKDLISGEITGEAVDEVPLVGNRGGIVVPTSKCAGMGFKVNTVREDDEVPSGIRPLDPNCRGVGERGREFGEEIESEDGEEILENHVDDAGR